MNRRIVSIVVLAMSLMLFGAFLHYSGQSDRLERFYVSEEEWNQIIDSRTQSDEINAAFLRFNYENLFRSDDNILYYSMSDSDNNAYNPSVQISNNYKLAISGETLSAESVEQNKQLDLLIYNDNNYQSFKLTTTSLPLVNITYDSDNYPSTREDVGMSMELYDNRSGVRDRIVTSDGKIHRRGSSSFDTAKASYSIKLTKESPGKNTRSNDISLLGMRKSNNWVLLNMTYDFEKCRDYFASNLWKISSSDAHKFDFDNSYELEYVEVIENGKYSGLYLLGHKPDDEMIEFDETAEHPNIMFKGTNTDEFYSFVTDQIRYLDNFELITDSVDRDLAYSVLKDYMKSLYGLDEDKLFSLSDYSNAIDFNIFVNFTQNIDIARYTQGMIKNCYITFIWDDDHYRAVLTPWDFDMALGSDSLSGLSYNMKADFNVILPTDLVAAMRRIGDTEIYKSLSNRYWYFRDGHWKNENISKLIDIIENKVYNSGAHRREVDRWPELNHSNSDDKMDTFRNYIFARLSYLDGYYRLWNYTAQESSDLYSIPNYVQVYLSTGVLLSPDAPEYYEAAKPETEEEVEEETEEYTEEEFVFF